MPDQRRESRAGFHALSRAFPALSAGVTLGVGMLAANRLFSSGSFLALARGTEWLLANVAWTSAAAGLLGTALLVAADRLGTLGKGRGAASDERRSPSTTSVTFWLLLALAGLSSFGGLVVQRGIAALAMVGLPENSFGSGVMAGMVLARARPLGPLVAGLVHDVLGPRWALGLTSGILGVSLIAMTRYAGPEAPWNELAAVAGVASAMAVAVVPAACMHLLGRSHFGYHYGLLYLGFALGEVFVVPLGPALAARPVVVLLVVAGAAAALAVGALWLRAADGGATEGE